MIVISFLLVVCMACIFVNSSIITIFVPASSHRQGETDMGLQHRLLDRSATVGGRSAVNPCTTRHSIPECRGVEETYACAPYAYSTLSEVSSLAYLMCWFEPRDLMQRVAFRNRQPRAHGLRLVFWHLWEQAYCRLSEL